VHLTGDGVINAAESHSVIFTIDGLDATSSGTVTFSDGTNTVTVAIPAGGNASYSADLSGLNDGTWTPTFAITDDHGNSANTTGNALTLDKTPPAVPSTPDLTTDSGASPVDNLTNATAPVFTGTADIGSTVTIYSDGVAVGSAITDNTGHYSVTTTT